MRLRVFKSGVASLLSVLSKSAVCWSVFWKRSELNHPDSFPLLGGVDWCGVPFIL